MLLTILTIILIWNLVPSLIVLFLPNVPVRNKLEAIVSFTFVAFPKGLLRFPIDILSPFVVPIALLFTKREANKLPWLFTWWDNDVSINGDRPEYSDPSYDGVTYYANAHPRSFKARYVWLGLRNRASRLSQLLGFTYTPQDQADRQYWGTPFTGRDHEGWVFNRAGKTYQLYIVKRLTKRYCFRFNYGHKIWTTHDGRPTANVVNITFSALTWKGQA